MARTGRPPSTIMGKPFLFPYIMPRSRTRYDLLRKRLERFTRLLQALEAGDVDAVHQVRVASRRLRELLPLLGLEAGVARKLGRRLRKVTRELGGVRELDVLLLTLESLRGTAGHDERAIDRIAAAVRADRASAGERLAAALSPDELARLARRLEREGKGLERAASRSAESARAWRWIMDARIARRARAVVDGINDAGAVYLPERLHVVRIAVKKLRYGVELRDESAGARRSPEQISLRQAQELLGRLHDLQVLLDRVRQVQASLVPLDLTAWRQLDRLVVALENDCRRLHARYMRRRAALVAVGERLSSSQGAGTRRRAEPRAS